MTILRKAPLRYRSFSLHRCIRTSNSNLPRRRRNQRDYGCLTAWDDWKRLFVALSPLKVAESRDQIAEPLLFQVFSHVIVRTTNYHFLHPHGAYVSMIWLFRQSNKWRGSFLSIGSARLAFSISLMARNYKHTSMPTKFVMRNPSCG